MKYKRTQEIRNENRARVGREDGGWGGGGGLRVSTVYVG